MRCWRPFAFGAARFADDGVLGAPTMTKPTTPGEALRLRITRAAFELTIPRTVLALLLAALAAYLKG